MYFGFSSSCKIDMSKGASTSGVFLGAFVCTCFVFMTALQPYVSKPAVLVVLCYPWLFAMGYICYAYIVAAETIIRKPGTVRLFKLAVIVVQQL